MLGSIEPELQVDLSVGSPALRKGHFLSLEGSRFTCSLNHPDCPLTYILHYAYVLTLWLFTYTICIIHMDSRGDDVEEEATGRYHVTDYAHVYRKVNGNTRHVSNANKEFLKFATEACHLSPSPAACKTTMRVVLNDLRRCGENDEVEYLTKSNSGFFTDRWCGWHITACRREIDGVLYLATTPPSSQAAEGFFRSLKTRILLKTGCAKSWLISRTLPDLLSGFTRDYIYGLPSRWPIFENPSPNNHRTTGSCSDVLGKSPLLSS